MRAVSLAASKRFHEGAVRFEDCSVPGEVSSGNGWTPEALSSQVLCKCHHDVFCDEPTSAFQVRIQIWKRM